MPVFFPYPCPNSGGKLQLIRPSHQLIYSYGLDGQTLYARRVRCSPKVAEKEYIRVAPP